MTTAITRTHRHFGAKNLDITFWIIYLSHTFIQNNVVTKWICNTSHVRITDIITVYITEIENHPVFEKQKNSWNFTKSFEEHWPRKLMRYMYWDTSPFADVDFRLAQTLF
jgi:hypothetical protein